MSAPIRVVAAVPDQDSVDAALQALAGAGFAPECDAVASEDAFAASLDPAPDLILCESGGSHLNASAVLPLVRKYGLNVPVIVSSARAGVEEAVALMKQGAADYLHKGGWEGLGEAARQALQHSAGSLLDRVRRGEAQFRGMMESMPALVSVFNKDRRRLYTNAARAAFAECDEDEIQRLGAFDLVHPDYLPAVEEYARACFEGRQDNEAIELKVITRTGASRWTRISGCLIEYEGGPAILSVGVDITKAKRAEQALRRREKQLRTIIECIPVMVEATDEDGTIILWNRECERVTGYSAAEIVGNPRALEFLYPDDAYRERKLEEWRDRGNAYRDWPWTLTCKDGTQRTVSWSNVSAEFPIPGWAAWKTGTDVTEQRQLERQIIDVGAREKRRIGRNLHDRLGQHLTGIGFKSELLAGDLAKRGLPEAAAAEEIQALVGEAIEQTRDLARGLSPVRRAPDGLMLALRGLSARTGDMFGVASSFVCEEPAFVHDKAAASHLYWIAHEAVTNAIKHGSPGHIRIALSSNNGGVTLTVEDDGLGFPDEPRDGQGMGLQIMEYRARMIEGLLDIRPRADGGARVTCEFREGTAAQP